MRLFFTDTANRTDVEQMLNRNIGEMMAQGEIREDALDTIVDEMLQAGSVVSNSENSPWIDETHEEIRSDFSSRHEALCFRADVARLPEGRGPDAARTGARSRHHAFKEPERHSSRRAEYGACREIRRGAFPDGYFRTGYAAKHRGPRSEGREREQTLADRLWDEARLEGAGRDQQEAYDRMVGALRDQTEVILREFAEDNHLTLREQTKQGSGETGTKSEAEQRRKCLQTLAEQDRREMERLRARENLGAGQRFVPNSSFPERYTVTLWARVNPR